MSAPDANGWMAIPAEVDTSVAPWDGIDVLLWCPKHYFGGGCYMGWWTGDKDTGYFLAPGSYMGDSDCGPYSTSATHWQDPPSSPVAP